MGREFVFACIISISLIVSSFAQCSGGGGLLTGVPEKLLKEEDAAYEFFFTILDGMTLGTTIATLGLGPALTAVLEFVFPEPTADVNPATLAARISCAVQGIADTTGLDTLINDLTSYMNLVNSSLHTYALHRSQNLSYIDDLQTALDNCNNGLSALQTNSFGKSASNYVALLPYAVSFAILHLSVLREFYVHGYPTDGKSMGNLQDQLDLVSTIDSTFSSYVSILQSGWETYKSYVTTQGASFSIEQNVFGTINYVSAKSTSGASLYNDGSNSNAVGVYFDQPANSYGNGSATLLESTAISSTYILLMSYVPYLHVLIPWTVEPAKLAPFVPAFLNTTFTIGPVSTAMGTVYFKESSSATAQLTGTWGSAQYGSTSDKSDLQYLSDDENFFRNGNKVLNAIAGVYNEDAYTDPYSSKCCVYPLLVLHGTYLSLNETQQNSATNGKQFNVDTSSWPYCTNVIHDSFSSASKGDGMFAFALNISVVPNVGMTGIAVTSMDRSGQKFSSFQTRTYGDVWNQACYTLPSLYPFGKPYFYNLTMGRNYFITSINQAGGSAAAGEYDASLLPFTQQGIGATFLHRFLAIPPSSAASVLSTDGRLLPYNWTTSSWNHTLQRLIVEYNSSLSYLQQTLFPAGFRTLLSIQLPYLASLVNQTQVESLLSYSSSALSSNNMETYLQSIALQLSFVLSNPFPMFVDNSHAVCGVTLPQTLASFLELAIGACEGFVAKYGSDPSLLPMMVPIATAHMAFVRELYVNGPVMYGKWKYCCGGSCNVVNQAQTYFESIPAARDPAWESTLVETLNYYVSFFNLMVPQWLAWRTSFLTSSYSSSSWSVSDRLTGTLVQGQVRFSGDCMQCFMNGTLVAMKNEMYAMLLDVLEPIQLFHIMVPELAKGAPVVVPQFARQTVELGPYAPAYPSALAGYNGALFWDKPGNITSVNGLSGEIINTLQFQYNDHTGFSMPTDGGNYFDITIAPATVVSFRGSFASQNQYAGQYPVLTSFQLLYNNGTFSPLKGSFVAGGLIAYFNATVGASYKLIETAQAFVPQPIPQYMNDVNLIGAMAFHFEHVAGSRSGELLSPQPVLLATCAGFLEPCNVVGCCAPLQCRRHACSPGCSNCTIPERFLCVAPRDSSKSLVLVSDVPLVSVSMVWLSVLCDSFSITIYNGNSFAVGTAGLFIQISNASSITSVEPGCLSSPSNSGVAEADCFVETLLPQTSVTRYFSYIGVGGAVKMTAQVKVFSPTAIQTITTINMSATAPC